MGHKEGGESYESVRHPEHLMQVRYAIALNSVWLRKLVKTIVTSTSNREN